MLYLNSIENAEASPTEQKFAICHEEVPSMQNIPELAPSQRLLAQWQSNEIDWEEFRERFTDEMRAEYRNEQGRLRRLPSYSLENDVALHSPEPGGEQTYRAILEGIINIIWESEGQTDRVINLAPEPVEESHLQEDIASLFGNTLHELKLTKDDNTRLLRENDELKRRTDQLEEAINTHATTLDNLRQTVSEKEGEIQSINDATGERYRENNELKTRIARLEGEINTHETIGDNLHQTVSEKEGEIQSLNDAIGERDREKDGLNRSNRELDKQVNTHETTIGNLNKTLSEKEEIILTKDDDIKSLQAESRNKNGENAELKRQIDQLRGEINTHTESIRTKDDEIQSISDKYEQLKRKFPSYHNKNIRDIAVKATRDNPVAFEIDFSNLVIDSDLPITLHEWLKRGLGTDQDPQSPFYDLIRSHTDYRVEYSLYGTFDKYDVPLADVIRTQRHLIAHPQRMDERTKMARVYCCFFAAALLSPKLSWPRQKQGGYP